MSLEQFLHNLLEQARAHNPGQPITLCPPALHTQATRRVAAEHTDVHIQTGAVPYQDPRGALVDRFYIRTGLHIQQAYWRNDLTGELLEAYQALRGDGLEIEEAHRIAAQLTN